MAKWREKNYWYWHSRPKPDRALGLPSRFADGGLPGGSVSTPPETKSGSSRHSENPSDLS